MNNLLIKIWSKKWMLRSILSTIYFNFHYLPFNQAIKLPIILYKPQLLKCKGSIQILGKVCTGMIQLGRRNVSIYPNTGITYENHGGNIIFYGTCIIGNDSYLSIGEKAILSIKNNFIIEAGLKLVTYRSISFGEGTRLGWGVLIMDTNFHPLYDMKKKVYKKASGPIEIGDYNWFGTQCKIMHSVKTPERCIFGMNSVITRNCEMKSYCIMGGSPVRILTENVMRDYDNDQEKY